MRTYITIALSLLALTSCSYKTNMWHYEEAKPRTFVKQESKQTIEESIEANVEEQISNETEPASKKSIADQPVVKYVQIIKPEPSTANTSTVSKGISKSYVKQTFSKERKLVKGKVTGGGADTDFLEGFIAAFFWGLIIFGITIGLLIGLVAAALSGVTWAAWVLGGLLLFGLVSSIIGAFTG
jgi:hypothetical protein